MTHQYNSMKKIWRRGSRRGFAERDAQQNRMRALAVGGVEDPIHVLLSLPSSLRVSKALQLIKGGASKWIHDTFPAHRNFSWQEGYGAFRIGITPVDDTVVYIERQAEHHRQRSY